MTEADYLQTQTTLFQLGALVQKLDLDGFVSAISYAETIGPIKDPTLFMRAQENVSAVKKLAEAFMPVQRAYDNAVQAVLNTSMRDNERELYAQTEGLPIT